MGSSLQDRWSFGPPPATRAVAFVWCYVRRRRRLFGALFAIVFLAAACAVGVQYGMKLIVDAMTEGDRSSPTVWYCLGLFLALIALEALLWRTGGWLGCRAIVATGVDVRLDLFAHLSGHSAAYFGRHLVGALGNRVTATAGSTAAILSTAVWKVLPPCIDFVGAVVVISTIDRRMALALVGVVALVSALMARFGIRARPLQHAFAKRAARVAGELIDVVANIGIVQADSGREREYRRLQDAFGRESRAQRRSWLYLERTRSWHDGTMCLLAGGMLAWALYDWRIGRNSPGDLVLISALTFRILHGSRDLALALVEASQQAGVVQEMLDVMAVSHDVPDRADASTFVPGRGEIRIERVRFGYDARSPLFDGLDLVIPAGQRIGIVGPSGAGKSTLLRLVPRVADVQDGRVVIDGQDVGQVRQRSLHDAIAVVPQDTALFHRSVRDNVRYARPDASDDEIRAAATAALCDEFIEALPDGYDTLVGERGVRLSGGQRQRIGLARALLKNPPILLLDEATSALDSHAENMVQQALLRLMEGRTVVAVAHRLSTLASFDRVIVMVDGRIVEDGPPQTLLASDTYFARTWRLQQHGLDVA